MKLRNLSIFIWGTLLFICVLNFQLHFFRFPFLSINLFEAIPEQSALIIECNDVESLNNLKSRSPFWNSIQKSFLFEKIKIDLSEIETRLLKSQDSTSFLENNPFIAALQMSSANSADFLYIINAEGLSLNGGRLIEQLENVRINKSIYLKESVYELTFPDNQRFAVCFYNSVILFARFPFMVEDAIAQLNNPTQALSAQRDFQLAKKSIDGKPGVSVYFNFKRLTQLMGSSIQNGQFNNLENLGSLVTFNFFAKEEEVSVGGTLITDSAIDQSSGAIKSKESKMFSVIPDNCSFLFWQSQNLNKTPDYSITDKAVFEEYMKPWIGDERAIFFTESRKAALEEQQFIVYQLKDKELASQYLIEYGKSKGKMQEIEYQTFTIKQLFSGEILQDASIFGESPLQSPFYTFVEDYVIFSNSRQSLEVLIDKFILSQTLVNNPSFLQYQSKLLTATNTFFYFNVPLFAPFLRQFTSTLEPDKIDAVFDILDHFNSIGVQLKRSGKQSDLHFYFNSSEDQTEPTKIIWSAKLAADAIIQPAVLKNTKINQNEIFIQDAENRIYLFNRNGKKLWVRNLKSPILSKINQIQYYGTGENHILFNTKNKIYIIDHDGKDVGTYPLELPSPASNGLCVIDFENDKEYEFFIGSQNGFAYAFEKTGEPVKGWNPRENMGKLIQDIQHFQVAGNDYILALNENGDFNVFKRNGEQRFETVSFDSKYLSPPGFQITNNNARIVMTNQSGKAQVFNLKGKHFNLYVGTGKDKAVKFLFEDVIGDKRKDYISLSERDLSCYYYDESDFKKAFSLRFEDPQDELFSIQFKDNQKAQIGTLSKTNNRISLVKNDGSLSKGFPLAGTTHFTIIDLFDTNKKVLIVALGNSIYTCKIDEEKDEK